GLSAAHDVLSREKWTGAELGEVVGRLMQPYDYADRLSAQGPKLRIAPSTAIMLSMGLQELATNAAKHGALSVPEGRVALGWRRRGGPVVREWRERGGPPVKAPNLTGFGSLLLGRVMARQLGHPAEITYAPEGLVCRLRAPTEAAAA